MYIRVSVNMGAVGSGLPKVIFLAVAEAEGKGGKTSALEVEAKGEAEGLVFGIWWAYSDIGFESPW